MPRVANAAKEAVNEVNKAGAEAAAKTEKNGSTRSGAKTVYSVKNDLSPDDYVVVKNGFQGMLIYVSPHTRERFVWQEFGDEQDMELRELRNARNSNKAYFENNWFMIEDEDVREWLGVGRYYRNALNYEEFDTIFEESPEEIARRVANLSEGQKTTLKYRARQMIRDGKVDSIRVITALEKSLNTELIER